MRLPRLYAPGLPQLVACPFSSALRKSWGELMPVEAFDTIASWLNDTSRAEGVRLHAWSLTPKGLRLIATPPHRQSLSRVVQAIGRRLGAQFRDGPVFAGRYKSCLLEPARWVMPAILWVESAPVYENYSQQPIHWRWSSAGEHCGSFRGPISPLSFHHDYWICGNTPFDRQIRHKAALSEGLLPDERNRLEQAIQGQWALGSEAFLLSLKSVASRRVTPAARGRPRKQPSSAPIQDTSQE